MAMSFTGTRINTRCGATCVLVVAATKAAIWPGVKLVEGLRELGKEEVWVTLGFEAIFFPESI